MKKIGSILPINEIMIIAAPMPTLPGNSWLHMAKGPTLTVTNNNWGGGGGVNVT